MKMRDGPNFTEQRYIATLERRLGFLRGRREAYLRAEERGEASSRALGCFDESEIKALAWAIEVANKWTHGFNQRIISRIEKVNGVARAIEMREGKEGGE